MSRLQWAKNVEKMQYLLSAWFQTMLQMSLGLKRRNNCSFGPNFVVKLQKNIFQKRNRVGSPLEYLIVWWDVVQSKIPTAVIKNYVAFFFGLGGSLFNWFELVMFRFSGLARPPARPGDFWAARARPKPELQSPKARRAFSSRVFGRFRPIFGPKSDIFFWKKFQEFFLNIWLWLWPKCSRITAENKA